jgi:hypothetical protein
MQVDVVEVAIEMTMKNETEAKNHLSSKHYPKNQILSLTTNHQKLRRKQQQQHVALAIAAIVTLLPLSTKP